MRQHSLLSSLALAAALMAGSATASAQDATADLRIEAFVENSCIILPTDMTGASFSGTASGQASSTNINVLCNAGTAYSVAPGDGLNFGAGSDPSRRHLADGQGNFIPYGLFHADGSTTWGESSPIYGVGTGQYEQHGIFVEFFQVNRAPGGNYSDTVVQTVTYN